MCLINMPAGAKAHLDCRSRSGLSRLGAAFGRFPPHNFPFPSGASAPQTLSQSGTEYFPTALAYLGNTYTHTHAYIYIHTYKDELGLVRIINIYTFVYIFHTHMCVLTLTHVSPPYAAMAHGVHGNLLHVDRPHRFPEWEE